MNAFSYELFINFRVSFHLRVKSAGVLTIKTFRKIMFDFKRTIHHTQPICDPRMLPGWNFVFRSTWYIYKEELMISCSPFATQARNCRVQKGTILMIEKECLAVVWDIKRFHLHLYGVHFVLQTNHEPLKHMNNAKFANGRLMRWAMFLQSYTFRVEAIKRLSA